MPVTLEVTGAVAVMTLNRPDQRNAIDTAMMQDLRAALARIEADAAVRVTILAGAGKVFCAGMDLAAFAAGERPGLNEPDGFAGFVRASRQKPVIAAVQGGAHAGGLELALACDLILAEEGALFSLPEVRLGLIAAGGGAIRLPRRIPPALAFELLLTGDAIDAARAAALGIVNRVVPAGGLMDAARDLAGRIAANAPGAVAETLALARRAADLGEAGLWQDNADHWARIDGSADAQEGARAFKERRPPRWAGSGPET